MQQPSVIYRKRIYIKTKENAPVTKGSNIVIDVEMQQEQQAEGAIGVAKEKKNK